MGVVGGVGKMVCIGLNMRSRGETGSPIPAEPIIHEGYQRHHGPMTTPSLAVAPSSIKVELVSSLVRKHDT